MTIDPRLQHIVAAQPYPLLFATISGWSASIRPVSTLWNRLGAWFTRKTFVVGGFQKNLNFFDTFGRSFAHVFVIPQ
jgi:hypothetical protein